MLNAQFLSRERLEQLGFAHLGDGVLVHETCVLVGCENISLGDRVRIDPFTVISAKASVEIGAYSHIAAHSTIMGAAGVTMGELCGVSQGVRILSTSDDYKAGCLIGPQMPDEFRRVHADRIVFEPYSCAGANCVVLPGARLREGATVGALSLIAGELEPWSVSGGVPAKCLGDRDRSGTIAAAEKFAAMRLRT